MSLARILNTLSFVALFLAYAITGIVVSISGQYSARMVQTNLPGRPLPAISELILFCDGSSWPKYLGFLFGLCLAAGLFLLDSRDQTRKFVPVGLTIAWAICALHLLAFIVAIGLLSIPESIH